MNIKYQKYGIISLLSGLNITLISTFLKYDRYWYAFLSFLSIASFINSSSALLIIVLIPGVGKEVNGARRWIPLGIMNFQKKVLTIL